MQISPFLSNESNKQYLYIGFAASKEFMESNPEGIGNFHIRFSSAFEFVLDKSMLS